MADTLPEADPIKAGFACLEDMRSILDQMAMAALDVTLADIPDIRAALQAAIYDRLIEDACAACDAEAGGMCRRHHELARQNARWTELLHRLSKAAT